MKTVFLLVALVSLNAHASDSFNVDGKSLTKPEAVRYVITHPNHGPIRQERCVVLSEKLTFKSCGRN